MLEGAGFAAFRCLQCPEAASRCFLYLRIKREGMELSVPVTQPCTITMSCKGWSIPSLRLEKKLGSNTGKLWHVTLSLNAFFLPYSAYD